MRKQKIAVIIFIFLMIIMFITVGLAVLFKNNEEAKIIAFEKGLKIKNVYDFSYNKETEEAYVYIETYPYIFNKQRWCIASSSEYLPGLEDSWQDVVDDKCYVKLRNGDKYIYIRDDKNNSNRINISSYVAEILKIQTVDNVKLIKDQIFTIDVTITKIGNPNMELTYTSGDEKIVKIQGNKLVGVGDGQTTVTVSDLYGNSAKITVQVTTLISLPKINNSKPFISNKQYTKAQAKILDDYLFYQIDQAGYKTRAGVVAAARYLSLELKYRIPYFIENGRLTHFNYQRPYCDGEGRYYHRGLYLSTDKFANIEKSVAGPAMWGAYIKEWSEDNGIIKNGLDCSGFVCWCLINGGFDFGDIGGGWSEGGIPTLSDRGIKRKITMQLLESRTVKAGDLIAYDGHIGIIIGVEDGYIYVADTLYHAKGLVVTKYSYKQLLNSDFTHIFDYTKEYGAEGNYTEMW